MNTKHTLCNVILNEHFLVISIHVIKSLHVCQITSNTQFNTCSSSHTLTLQCIIYKICYTLDNKTWKVHYFLNKVLIFARERFCIGAFFSSVCISEKKCIYFHFSEIVGGCGFSDFNVILWKQSLDKWKYHLSPQDLDIWCWKSRDRYNIWQC